MTSNRYEGKATLVLGGTGKTGRRVADSARDAATTGVWNVAASNRSPSASVRPARRLHSPVLE